MGEVFMSLTEKLYTSCLVSHVTVSYCKRNWNLQASLGSRNKEKDLVNNWLTFATLAFMISFVTVL